MKCCGPQRRRKKCRNHTEVNCYGEGLILKQSYWRWPQRNLAGNTIDFFVRVLGLSFHQAMREISGS